MAMFGYILYISIKRPEYFSYVYNFISNLYIKGEIKMRFDSDNYDEVCEQIKGHTNWAYADEVTPEIRTREINKGNVIIFFDKFF